MTDTQLNQAIKRGEVGHTYLLWGEESALLEGSLKKLVKLVTADGEAFLPFNLHQFDGETIGVSEVTTAYEALPMMAAKKCVVVKNWKVDKLPKKEFDALLALLEKPNPTSVLILYYTREFDPKKAKNKKLLEVVKKQGIACEFARKSTATLQTAIQKVCAKEQVTIRSDAAGMLILRCQSQYQLIQNELGKMMAYVGAGGEITSEIVARMGCVSVQASAFDLSTAILKGQADRAFVLLDQLFYLRTEPVMIMGALGAVVSDLHRLKMAQRSGISLGQVQRDFSYASRFRLEKSQEVAKRASLDAIHRMIAALNEADHLLKSSKLDDRTILEVAVSKMLATSTAAVGR